MERPRRVQRDMATHNRVKHRLITCRGIRCEVCGWEPPNTSWESRRRRAGIIHLHHVIPYSIEPVFEDEKLVWLMSAI
jgi:hypothetical protein